MTFSRQLLRSLFVLLALLALALVLVVSSQRTLLQNAALTTQDAFVPAVRVERIMAIAQALSSSTTAGSMASDVSLEQTCSLRQTELLTGRVLAGFGLNAVFDARQRLAVAFASAQAVAPTGCRGFVAEVDLVLRTPGLWGEQPASVLQSRVAQALTERVSWVSVPPCLYIFDGAKSFYLRGPQGYCLSPHALGQPELASTLSLDASVRGLTNLTYTRLLGAQSVSGDADEARRFALTLRPRMAQQLERYSGCWSSNEPCDLDMPIPLARTQGATVAVLDAQTGEVLALRCFGPVCDAGSLAEAQPLAAALLEAPPASVAKLFFSLALAETASVPRDLRMQIKTSGQLDATVVKRNEWWERTALCDLQSRPLGSAPHGCAVPERAMQIATRFGWNADCGAQTKDCGRVALSADLASLPGFMGVLRPLAANTVPAGRSTTASAAARQYLNWNDYNRIRASGGVTQIGAPYREASAAVQAVLGAAETRTSALGLASLASSLYRASRGEVPRAPQLIRVLGDQTQSPTPITPARADRSGELRSLIAPARMVREGMAKVLTPAEPGWSGDGTAHAAFRTSFGRSCPADCPVEGKTGTVSARDPRFAGTTTFTGIVDVTRLHTLMGIPPVVTASLPPVLAIGVIVFPYTRGEAVAGHAASHLALRLVRDLTVGRAP